MIAFPLFIRLLPFTHIFLNCIGMCCWQHMWKLYVDKNRRIERQRIQTLDSKRLILERFKKGRRHQVKNENPYVKHSVSSRAECHGDHCQPLPWVNDSRPILAGLDILSNNSSNVMIYHLLLKITLAGPSPFQPGRRRGHSSP